MSYNFLHGVADEMPKCVYILTSPLVVRSICLSGYIAVTMPSKNKVGLLFQKREQLAELLPSHNYLAFWTNELPTVTTN